MPKVSIILCTYKCGENALPTIDSILRQSLTDFELIAIDDASGDGTANIIKSVKDDRVRFFENDVNLGIVGSRNKGLKLAAGQFIAHCDHDDIWQPNKLEKQVEEVDKNPSLGLCGTEFNIFVNGKYKETTTRQSYSHNFLHWSLFLNSTFLHSSILMRASTLKEHKISYREGLDYADDWYIYHQLAKVSDIFIIPEALTDYHLHGKNWSIQAKKKMNDNGSGFLLNEISSLTGEQYHPDKVKDFFSTFVLGNPCSSIDSLEQSGHFLKKIFDSFCKQYRPSMADIDAIEKFTSERWWRAVSATAADTGMAALRSYSAPGTPNWASLSKTNYFKAVLKVMANKVGLLEPLRRWQAT